MSRGNGTRCGARSITGSLGFERAVSPKPLESSAGASGRESGAKRMLGPSRCAPSESVGRNRVVSRDGVADRVGAETQGRFCDPPLESGPLGEGADGREGPYETGGRLWGAGAEDGRVGIEVGAALGRDGMLGGALGRDTDPPDEIPPDELGREGPADGREEEPPTEPELGREEEPPGRWAIKGLCAAMSTASSEVTRGNAWGRCMGCQSCGITPTDEPNLARKTDAGCDRHRFCGEETAGSPSIAIESGLVTRASTSQRDGGLTAKTVRSTERGSAEQDRTVCVDSLMDRGAPARAAASPCRLES